MKKGSRTYMAKPHVDNSNKWYLIDAEGKILGRLATKIASILMGKLRPEYTPGVDCGDHVVVINAAKVKVTGTNKPKQKMYQRYSGYQDGLKETSLETMLETKPTEVIREAVRRMIPKNTLAHKMITKLKVYADAEHQHSAQCPEKI